MFRRRNPRPFIYLVSKIFSTYLTSSMILHDMVQGFLIFGFGCGLKSSDSRCGRRKASLMHIKKVKLSNIASENNITAN